MEEKAYRFEAQEVLTLHIRAMSGEQRVQALGERTVLTVERTDAEKRLDQHMKGSGYAGKKLLPYVVLFAVGLVWLILWLTVLPERERALLLPGPAAIFAGIAGGIVTLKELSKRKKELGGMDREKALRDAAWEIALERAPKKAGDNDITYIPLDSRTKGMGKKDLVLTYDLLPEIAGQFLKKTV